MLLQHIKKTEMPHYVTVENFHADSKICQTWGRKEWDKLGSLSDKSGSPLLCPSLFVGWQ